MISNPHRTNSDFQLKYFIANSCHTPDAAYSLLYGQKIDIEQKIAHNKAEALRRETLRELQNRAIEKYKEVEKDYSDKTKPMSKFREEDCFQLKVEYNEALANLMDLDGSEPVHQMNLLAAKKELETIQKLMAELLPQCKYHTGNNVLEASELMQQEEWLCELKARAENYILSDGTIPHDQIAAMRLHPEFQTLLIPHIQTLFEKIGRTHLLISGDLMITDQKLLE